MTFSVSKMEKEKEKEKQTNDVGLPTLYLQNTIKY